jgi:hypothetical protein
MDKNDQPKYVYVITMVSLGEDPLEYDTVVGVFLDEQVAHKVLKECQDELEGGEGIHYFIEEASIDYAVSERV